MLWRKSRIHHGTSQEYQNYNLDIPHKYDDDDSLIILQKKVQLNITTKSQIKSATKYIKHKLVNNNIKREKNYRNKKQQKKYKHK